MKTTKRKSKTTEKASTPVAETAAAAPAESAARAIALSSHCTIKDAAALKAGLAAMVDESAEVTLDVGSVERIDTATMQLICAFVRDRGQRDRKVIWKGESQPWRDAVRLLGTGELLGCSLEGARR